MSVKEILTAIYADNLPLLRQLTGRAGYIDPADKVLFVMAAIGTYNIPILDFLMERFPDITQYVPLYAVKYGDPNLLDYLSTKGIGLERGFQEAVESDNHEAITYFLQEYPINPNDGLEIAARYGNLNLVEHYLNEGATDIDRAIGEAKWRIGTQSRMSQHQSRVMVPEALRLYRGPFPLRSPEYDLYSKELWEANQNVRKATRVLQYLQSLK